LQLGCISLASLLAKENNGTRVTFSESGLDAWLDDEVRGARFERIRGDFRMVLKNLKAYLERKPLPFLFEETNSQKE
jgi:hypothetical protein